MTSPLINKKNLERQSIISSLNEEDITHRELNYLFKFLRKHCFNLKQFQISEATSIPVTYISSLENADYHKLSKEQVISLFNFFKNKINDNIFQKISTKIENHDSFFYSKEKPEIKISNPKAKLNYVSFRPLLICEAFEKIRDYYSLTLDKASEIGEIDIATISNLENGKYKKCALWQAKTLLDNYGTPFKVKEIVLEKLINNKELFRETNLTSLTKFADRINEAGIIKEHLSKDSIPDMLKNVRIRSGLTAAEVSENLNCNIKTVLRSEKNVEYRSENFFKDFLKRIIKGEVYKFEEDELKTLYQKLYPEYVKLGLSTEEITIATILNDNNHLNKQNSKYADNSFTARLNHELSIIRNNGIS